MNYLFYQSQNTIPALNISVPGYRMTAADRPSRRTGQSIYCAYTRGRGPVCPQSVLSAKYIIALIRSD